VISSLLFGALFGVTFILYLIETLYVHYADST
jgi:hypothetical protein